ITRGARLRGVLEYLFGPGDRDEHRDQHVIAGYLSALELEPRYNDAGKALLGDLSAELAAPYEAAGRRGSKQWVWHCSLSLRADEGQLSDDRWREITERFVVEMGFSETEDQPGCRWVAVRHGLSQNGNDHVHLVVTLATEDGRPVRVNNDFPRSQKVCRALEDEFGLMTAVVGDGRSARRAPSQVELARAKDQGREVTDREWLRHQVRVAAAGAGSELEWVTNMRAAGLMVSVRADKKDPEQVAGYAVARPVPEGEKPFWISGRKLDGELSVVKIRQRWPEEFRLTVEEWRDTGRPSPSTSEATPVVDRIAQWQEATQRIRKATEIFGSIEPGSADADVVMRAAADVAVRAAWVTEPRGVGPVTRASHDLSRAAVPTRRPVSDRPSQHGLHIAADLSAVAASIASAGRASTTPEIAAMMAVIAAVARLVLVAEQLRGAAGRHSAATVASQAGRHMLPLIKSANRAGVMRTRSEVATKRTAQVHTVRAAQGIERD
nr:relaxase [Longispora sp. (in: high G+C Gram-positive bacteria)]